MWTIEVPRRSVCCPSCGGDLTQTTEFGVAELDARDGRSRPVRLHDGRVTVHLCCHSCGAKASQTRRMEAGTPENPGGNWK